MPMPEKTPLNILKDKIKESQQSLSAIPEWIEYQRLREVETRAHDAYGQRMILTIVLATLEAIPTALVLGLSHRSIEAIAAGCLIYGVVALTTIHLGERIATRSENRIISRDL